MAVLSFLRWVTWWHIASWFFVRYAFAQFPTFDVSTTFVGRCEDIIVRWQGGIPPFNILVLAPGMPTRTIPVPDEDLTPEGGQAAVTIIERPGQEAWIVLVDAAGLNRLSTSQAISVGTSPGLSCPENDLASPFTFAIQEDPITQCSSFQFMFYARAVQPVTIFGFTRNSTRPVIMSPPEGPNFTWTAALWGGTDVMFTMVDALGRDGGSSRLLEVQPSVNTSCGLPQANVAGSATPTTALVTTVTRITSTSRTSAPNPSSSPQGGVMISTPVIIGIVIACIAAACFAVIVAFCLHSRLRPRRRRFSGLPRPNSIEEAHGIDIDPATGNAYTLTPLLVRIPTASSVLSYDRPGPGHPMPPFAPRPEPSTAPAERHMLTASPSGNRAFQHPATSHIQHPFPQQPPSSLVPGVPVPAAVVPHNRRRLPPTSAPQQWVIRNPSTDSLGHGYSAYDTASIAHANKDSGSIGTTSAAVGVVPSSRGTPSPQPTPPPKSAISIMPPLRNPWTGTITRQKHVTTSAHKSRGSSTEKLVRLDPPPLTTSGLPSASSTAGSSSPQTGRTTGRSPISPNAPPRYSSLSVHPRRNHRRVESRPDVPAIPATSRPL